MARCGQLIDPRQHGFLKNKSYNTQLVDFCDTVSLSFDNHIRSDVIHFDFSKAFDSINHDLILTKIKSLYLIYSFLLQFISHYLMSKQQTDLLLMNYQFY